MVSNKTENLLLRLARIAMRHPGCDDVIEGVLILVRELQDEN